MNAADAAIKSPGQAGTVDLLAGVLCLDFANTVEPRVESVHGEWPRDYLATYDDLIAWSRHAARLDEETARQLLAAAAIQQDAARVALEQALALREAIDAIFRAMVKRRDVPSSELGILGAAYARAMSRALLTPTGPDYEVAWVEDPSDLTRPLWPIAQSAVDLLVRGEKKRIKDCSDAGCGWLFYDTSKNLSRRWCSMRDCGMHAKERRRAKRGRGRPGHPRRTDQEPGS